MQRKMRLVKNKLAPRTGTSSWEKRTKIGSFIATCISAASIIIGGIVGIYSYQEQSRRENQLKEEELRLRRYNDARSLYFELISAASAVGASTSREEAIGKFADYTKIYFGKAHIFVLDDDVHNAKIEFYDGVKPLLLTEEFPSRKISKIGLNLAEHCKESLKKIENGESYR